MQKSLQKQDLDDEYSALLDFARAHNRLSYSDFDNFTLEKVNLFVMPKDEHFKALEHSLNKVIQALPAFKRILSKPITRLKDIHNVLPVESVRVINSQSMSHVSRHSELWGDITGGELKPKKLMTLDRQEDYAIYENVAFVRLINTVLAYVKKNIRLLKDILYANRDLHFNLLERTNHLSYFLAIGKLHMGYARAQDEYHVAYERCLDKLLFIDNTLRSKLHSPVYRYCRKNTSKLTLKKTNIFRLQKDYRQVYTLLKWFWDDSEEITDEPYVGQASREGYTAYCNMLAVFAAGHFNFEFSAKKRLNFLNLGAEAAFKGWTLTMEEIRCDGIRGLLLSFKKDVAHRICLMFCHNGEHPAVKIEHFKQKCPAEEYYFADPWEYGAKNFLYLSLFDIDSFRRIQQLFLRGMVYADNARDTCPFCGKTLEAQDGGHLCKACRTFIKEKTCPETGERYYETSLYDYVLPRRYAENDTKRSKFLVDKFTEAQLFFRNITAITLGAENICPKCGKSHR